LTLRGLLGQLLGALTTVDGRLLRTFGCLVARPGSLTLAYLQGQRKPYVGPVPLFLIANALFFAIESLTGGKVFTTPLEAHLHTQPWSRTAELLVSQQLAVRQTTLESYAPVFDHAVAVNARTLIVFMALSFVGALAIVFPGNRRPPVTHALFSLHLYAFLLPLLCVATAVPPVDRWFGGAGFASEGLDHALSILLLIASAIYLFVATGRVYGATGAGRSVRVLMLTTALAVIVLGYRFVLLLITLYST
jgi:hypothetical protein